MEARPTYVLLSARVGEGKSSGVCYPEHSWLTELQAFESPLLKESNSNSSGRDIAKALGKTETRYGAAMDAAGQTSRLVFANPSRVEVPRREARFNE